MAKNRSEEPVRFSMAFLGKVAPAGRKIQGSNRPEIIATSTKDKFVLNDKACMLMGVEEGSKIVMIDQNLYIKNADEKLSQDKRFFLAVAPEDYSGNTATVGKQKAFSYSGVWSAILMNDPQITEASAHDLIDAGLGLLRGEKGKNYVGLKKVAMKLAQYTETDEDGNVIEHFPLEEGGTAVNIYTLADAQFRDHTPKSEGEEDDDTAEAEVTEEVEA